MNLSYCVPRQRKLLKILLTKNEWLTGIQLSCMLHVTDRTVRSDVSVLNYILEQYHSSIISARGKGYCLQTQNKEALLFVLSKNSELNNISKESCVRRILLLLLTTDKKFDLYDLEEKFFISRTSLESYIKNIEKILVNFSSLEIMRKHGKIKLSGPESSIRFMLNEILKIQYDHEL
ncbi:MAG: HTH domain-containing protein, partial [Selenomonadaceae bacterium]